MPRTVKSKSRLTQVNLPMNSRPTQLLNCNPPYHFGVMFSQLKIVKLQFNAL